MPHMAGYKVSYGNSTIFSCHLHLQKSKQHAKIVGVTLERYDRSIFLWVDGR